MLKHYDIVKHLALGECQIFGGVYLSSFDLVDALYVSLPLNIDILGKAEMI